MILDIDRSSTLSEIASVFSGYYPFLKLEFFELSHNLEESSSNANILPKSKLVSEITLLNSPVQIEVHFWNKTATVEQMFKNKVGLHVQVFRKFGETWIQTAGTDDLTLEEQNSIGKKESEDNLHGTDRKFESELY